MPAKNTSYNDTAFVGRYLNNRLDLLEMNQKTMIMSRLKDGSCDMRLSALAGVQKFSICRDHIQIAFVSSGIDLFTARGFSNGAIGFGFVRAVSELAMASILFEFRKAVFYIFERNLPKLHLPKTWSIGDPSAVDPFDGD